MRWEWRSINAGLSGEAEVDLVLKEATSPHLVGELSTDQTASWMC